MAMIDTAITPEEAKAHSMPCAVGGEGNLPKYPYGLTLCLNSETLKKLGMATPPAVGSKLSLHAMVEVVAARQDKEQDGDVCASTDLQVTAMELTAPVATSEERAAALYKS